MIELKFGDCLEIMKDIPNNSIDLIITDPPYRTTSRGGSGTMGGYWKGEKARTYEELSFDFYKKLFFTSIKSKYENCRSY